MGLFIYFIIWNINSKENGLKENKLIYSNLYKLHDTKMTNNIMKRFYLTRIV